MTRNKIIKELGKAIEEKTEIKPDTIIIKGYNKEGGNIKELVISTSYSDSGYNIASQIKNAIDEVSEKYDLFFQRMYLDL